ncbi:SDR family NAD(P)-dependent oxidoreductase [Amycolatopsis magusensis]|uniref:SDR family NAD(P)-dependent oxidoreductase n=1 Tax=Amycolatopsis magusensis TaxID=882444 RepID=UPI00379191F0
MNLSNRTALVTGSTDGIGVAIARALAAEGARVLVSGRDTARGEKVAAAIAEAGGQADFVRADLAEGLSAARALATEPIDILVNNAAMLLAPQPTAEVAEETIDRALAVNIKAAFLLTGLIAPGMAARGHGAIVNLGSINGLNGSAGSALYSTTKAAMHSLTKSWADEYGPSGVRVNTVAPGPTTTEKTAKWDEHIAPLIARAPSRRTSKPEEIAQAVVFLAGAHASNIHGALLTVDGGFSAV